jgi:hypothetical protein
MQYDCEVSPKATKRGTLEDLVSAAVRHGPSVLPLSRETDGGVMDVMPCGDGWLVGVELFEGAGDWPVHQILMQPVLGANVAIDGFRSDDLSRAVFQAQERAAKRKAKLREISQQMTSRRDFIEANFSEWRRKQSRKSNFEYAALAAKYAEEVQAGNAKATATLADELGLSPAVVAQRIKDARHRLLLTEGEQGRASGELTRLGLYYTDKHFPGLKALRLEGMTIPEIAEKYGLPEAVIWRALHAEGSGNLIDDSEIISARLAEG